MANRRCLQALTRRASSLFSTTHPFQSLSTPSTQILENIPSKSSNIFTKLEPTCHIKRSQILHFSSDRRDDELDDDDHGDGDDDDDDDEDDDEDDEEEVGESSEYEGVSASGVRVNREYTEEEKEAEAAAIGYKVIGPLERSDIVFTPYEPVFAVVQIGSHQFKVSNRDCIFTERLKFCDVNDKIILNKVLLLGSSSQTIVGRPVVPDAAVHAVVEEHALDAKVIIFKKKRRKNYRRTKGHRQELTKLRITDIQGIEKPEKTVPVKPPKAARKKQEEVAVAA